MSENNNDQEVWIHSAIGIVTYTAGIGYYIKPMEYSEAVVNFPNLDTDQCPEGLTEGSFVEFTLEPDRVNAEKYRKYTNSKSNKKIKVPKFSHIPWLRLSVLAEMQKKLTQVTAQEIILKANLLAIAPEYLYEWLQVEDVLNTLFHYGQTSFKIHFDSYGFTDIEDIKQKLQELISSWDNQIEITFHEPEEHRVNVEIKIV